MSKSKRPVRSASARVPARPPDPGLVSPGTLRRGRFGRWWALGLVLAGLALAAALLLSRLGAPERAVFSVALTNPAVMVGPVAQAAQDSLDLTDPAVVAQGYCQTCHLYPEPALLDRTSWLEGALVLMGIRLGVAQMDLDQRPDGQIIKEAQIFPTAPILPENHWMLILQHYSKQAPAQPLPPPARPAVHTGLRHFRVRGVPPRAQLPRTCFIQIDEIHRRLLVADAATHTLDIFNSQGQRSIQHLLPGDPVRLIPHPGGFQMTMIGELLPSDFLHGSVGLFSTNQNRYTSLLENLRRPTDAAFADLNQDGKEDIVVCQFGNILGRLSWFKNLGDGQYEEFVLFDWPGSTFTFVRDMNRDGRPDIVALIGQAREGIYLFLNQGNDEFEQIILVQQPPVWGYSDLELVDFNGDGLPDLLAVNGDNGDYFSRSKAYHGIRLYLNDGQNQFQEAWFHPWPGAYAAEPADFDGDGDLDIAAISFFPDYEKSPGESFIFLENKGSLQFETSTFPESGSGRWLVMDSGDLDGDGDVDVALGSFLPGPSTVAIPPAMHESWQTNGVSVLILENTWR